MKYTKDQLICEFIEMSKRNIEAFDGVKEALEQLNDHNILHASKEEARDLITAKLVNSNEKFYKLISYLLMILVFALISLAGAEKVLKFFPNI
jgi:hypothetical protein